MTLPNFLVVGSGRAGTTSLHHALRRHPEVFVPAVKAPSYYYAIDAVAGSDRRRLETRSVFVRDADAYEALFDDAAGAKAIGEVSPAYLASRKVPARIAASLPDARLVAILRNPIDRLWARFVARRRDGLETRDRLEALIRQETCEGLVREDAAGTYVPAGFVSHVLEEYDRRFPPEQIRIFLFEDLVSDPSRLVRQLFAYLGVDPEVPFDAHRHNRSGGEIADPLVRWLWTRTASARLRLRPLLPQRLRDAAFARATRRLVPQRIDPDDHRVLAQIYADEIARLERRLDRDLSHWLRPPEAEAAR